MITSYIIGIGGVVFLMTLWVIIQQYWGKVFSDITTDPDPMAERSTCGNCGCTTICEKEGGPRQKQIIKQKNR